MAYHGSTSSTNESLKQKHKQSHHVSIRILLLAVKSSLKYIVRQNKHLYNNIFIK